MVLLVPPAGIYRSTRDAWEKHAKAVALPRDPLKRPTLPFCRPLANQPAYRYDILQASSRWVTFADPLAIAEAVGLAPSQLDFYLSSRRSFFWDPKVYNVQPVCTGKNAQGHLCRSTDLNNKGWQCIQVLDTHDYFLLFGIRYECRNENCKGMHPALNKQPLCISWSNSCLFVSLFEISMRLSTDVVSVAAWTTTYDPEARALLPPSVASRYPAVHVKQGSAISKDLYNDIERVICTRQPVEGMADQINMRYHDRCYLHAHPSSALGVNSKGALLCLVCL